MSVGDAPAPGWWARWWPRLRPAVLLVVALVVARIVIGLVGAIDWSAVATALRGLSPWQALVMLLLLLVRQGFNAVPLARFVPGLRLARSMQNDLTAALIGTVAPPPADVVLRVSMFRSWQLDPVAGMAGVTLNMLAFYAVRFSVPVLGLVLLAFEGVESGHVVAALLSLAVAVVILVVLYLVVRGDGLAALVGRTAGRVVRRVKASVDPEGWALAVVDFRSRMATTLRAGLVPSMAALVVMVLVDGTMLTFAQRVVGVPASVLPLATLLGVFLVAYPLTLFPLVGFGILDAALVAAWTAQCGTQWEASLVAGLVLWRVFALLGPLVLGLGALLWWRRSAGAQVPHESPA